MQVKEKVECATVLSSKQQERTHKKHVYQLKCLSWLSKETLLSDDLSKRGGAYGVKRDLRFAGWLSDRSLKVSEEILNFMRE